MKLEMLTSTISENKGASKKCVIFITVLFVSLFLFGFERIFIRRTKNAYPRNF